MQSYIFGRKHRTKINHTFSSWIDLILGVPQGSILGPLLFNIFLCGLFFVRDIKIASYADDNTPYVCRDNIASVINELEHASIKLFDWFSQNCMKANPNNSHLLLSSSQTNTVNIANNLISSTRKEKLLGILIENNLRFDEHVTELCNKDMNLVQRKTIMNAFKISQFGYCPLVWMFYSRTLNNRINQIHERALRLVYRDQKSTFEELLNKDRFVKIHHRNIQLLAIKIYKSLNNLSPEIMNDIFTKNNSSAYELRSHDGIKKLKRRQYITGQKHCDFRGLKFGILY